MNKIRRLLAFVLCLCLSFPAVAFAVEDDGAAKDSEDGNPAAAAEGGEINDITEEPQPAADSENTVYIYNEEDLRILAENCSLDTWSMDKTVVLEADIVLGETASEFLPIPVFCGTFDGGGHSIGGFTMTGSIAGAGLFGTVGEGAVIRQLKVIGQVSPSGDADTIGGLAGINHGKLVNCTFEGAVQGNATVGGIVGLNGETGQVAGCSFSGTLTGEHYVGGIAGQNFGSIFRCTNNGSINTIAAPVKTELSDIGFDHLLSMENVPAGTDIGGIAGFS